MKGINDECYNNGYSVTFTNSDNSPRAEVDNIKRLCQQNISGIILDPVYADNPAFEFLNNNEAIMIDRQSSNLLIDTVVCDNENSVYKFILLMKAKGYEDIYFVSTPLENISTRIQRYKGFKKAMNLLNDNNLIVYYSDEQVKHEIENLIKLKNQKLGFFTVNGSTLLKLMRSVKDLKLLYPTDFGIGTYEDLDWMKILNPGMSCIRQKSYEMGVVAAKHLIHKINSEENFKPKLIEVGTEIIIMESF